MFIPTWLFRPDPINKVVIAVVSSPKIDQPYFFLQIKELNLYFSVKPPTCLMMSVLYCTRFSLPDADENEVLAYPLFFITTIDISTSPEEVHH